jgi:hypothetical protein
LRLWCWKGEVLGLASDSASLLIFAFEFQITNHKLQIENFSPSPFIHPIRPQSSQFGVEFSIQGLQPFSDPRPSALIRRLSIPVFSASPRLRASVVGVLLVFAFQLPDYQISQLPNLGRGVPLPSDPTDPNLAWV